VSSLPIDEVLPALERALDEAGAAVVVAPPGAGKTSRVPLAVLPKVPGEVWLLEPRRLAARWAAARMAAERGERLGETVGYQVRFDRKVGPRTRVRVVTEGILTRRLIDDPFLEGVGAVIVDEFHERSVDADLALALLREIRAEVRPDLRIIVMSATLDPEPVQRFLGGCAAIVSAGRAHPVEIEHDPGAEDEPLEARVSRAVRRELRRSEGDLLVFLPGVPEIRRAASRLEGIDADVRQLYGDLDLSAQEAALASSARRRIILATNVAESSLTVEGISTVIDTGLAKRAEYDPGRGVDRLMLRPIGRYSADQRAGRAGRLGPGRAVRLWSEKAHRTRPDADPPEIHRVDATSSVLALFSYGVSDPAAFAWFDPPAPARIEVAQGLLRNLGALERDGSRLTDLGRWLSRVPLHPRWGALLHHAARLGAVDAGLDVVALADTKEGGRAVPSGGDRVGSSDLWELRQAQLSLDGRLPPAARRTRQQLARLLEPRTRAQGAAAPEAVDEEEAILEATWIAFSDRLARASADGRLALAEGTTATLDPQSVVKDADLLVAIRVDEHRGRRRVRWASRVKPAWLEGEVEKWSGWRFLPGEDRVAPVEERRVRGLVLERKTAPRRPPEDPGVALAAAARRDLDRALPWTPVLERWLARYRFARTHAPELELPPEPEDVRLALLDTAAMGCTKFSELQAVDLVGAWRATWPRGAASGLAEIAPDALRVPSGRQVSLRYRGAEPPVLSARLQELFGWSNTPTVARGRVPVVVELLAPNQRPVQVTSDLGSFWRTTYAEVRKELRRRYPKHHWPEDPSEGDPKARPGRRR